MAPDTLSVEGKIAIVTGSGREKRPWRRHCLRIGSEWCFRHYQLRFDSSAPRAERVAEKIRAIGGKAVVSQADLTTLDGAKKLVADTLKGFNTDKIDIVVNNAGHGLGQGILAKDTDPAVLEQSLKINAFSTQYTIQAATPYLAENGRVVNIGTVVSTRTNMPGLSVYGVSKAAQDYLTGIWAYELGRSKNVTVNTVAPGGMATDAVDWFPEGEHKETVKSNMMANMKLKPALAGVEDVANIVLFLASPQGQWVTGQRIDASGGMS